MFKNLPFFPEQASAQAAQVDAIYFFMVAVTAFFSLLIAALVVAFAIKFRRRRDNEIGVAIHGSIALELLWSVIPLVIAMVMFAWGAKVFFDLYRPPAGAMEIFIVGKQWMWKAQHADGMREINELHVPVGRPVKLIMGSEDVIHSYYIPAFRVHRDQARTVSPVLRRVLRHEAFGHDRMGDGDGAVGIPGVARWRRTGEFARRRGAEAVQRSGVRHLPPAQRHGTRAGVERHLRQERGVGGREHRHRR
jgi:hypothetical protein